MDDDPLDVMDTPEGRAVYPFGAWGAGYLVDAATEHRLRGYLKRMIWVVIGSLAAQSLVRIFVVRAPDLVGLAAGAVTACVFHCVVLRIILRKATRAAFRPGSDELLRHWVARRGRVAIVARHVTGLVVFSAVIVMLLLLGEGPERWAFVATCAILFGLAVVGLRRVLRLPDTRAHYMRASCADAMVASTDHLGGST